MNTTNAWAPLYWEPVTGTGERLTAGVIVRFNGAIYTHRLLRDDILDCLYGKAATGARHLIDTALDLSKTLLSHVELENLPAPMGGFSIGASHHTEPESVAEALRHAALMYSSMANLDKLDTVEDSDAPTQEETNKRFATEVRDGVIKNRPELEKNFNRAAVLLDGGEPVRFGYLSSRAVMHFGVLHPVRQSASVRDARARLWELLRAKNYATIGNAALIVATPRTDDPTLGGKQIEAINRNVREIEREAKDTDMIFHPVTSVTEAVGHVMQLA